jgi:Putative adhesin
LTLHSGDGNIDAEAEAGSKNTTGWNLHTGDGNIALRLPSDFAADLDAETGDGRVNIDLPLMTNESAKERIVRGKINGGGSPLELRTGDGNIDLEKS